MPKMNVIKSIYVDAAPEKIYPIINDLSNWEQWSPWVIAEPNAQLNVAADGKYHEWDGEIIGHRAEAERYGLHLNVSRRHNCTVRLPIQSPVNTQKAK